MKWGDFLPFPGAPPFTLLLIALLFDHHRRNRGQSQGLDCYIVRALLNHGYQQ